MRPPSARQVVALGAFVALVSCDRRPSDADFKRELVARLDEDQRVREVFANDLRTLGRPSDSTARLMLHTDSVNVGWLKPLLLRWGFPSRAQVGKEGQQAAFLLVQHADQDPGFQAAVLPLLDSAFARGEIPGEAVAMLTDRVRAAQHQRQLYGTQLKMPEGRVVIDPPVEDSAGLDARRARMGLPPMQEYLRVADSAYGVRPAPVVRKSCPE
jgi:hypothetical protein